MTTATTTLTLAGPDVAIVKQEVFDVDFARWIIDNKDIGKDDRDAVRRLYKNRTNGNQHVTNYKLGKDIKHADVGRWCALRGEGLQCVSRDCRAALAQRYYWDVDIRNAQPTLLQQYAEKHGWICDKLKSYNENRDDHVQDIQDTFQIERGEAKERVCRVMFGGMCEGLTPFFVNELQPELRKLMENVYAANQKEYPSIAKRGIRSLMALILQTEERKCLMALDTSLSRQGRSLDVLIHDGGLVRKKDGESRMPEEILRKAEIDILATTGYKVSLAVKELKTTLERGDSDDDEAAYQALRTQWEETGWKGYTTFYLREQSCFVKVPDKLEHSILMKHKTDLYCDEEANYLPNGDLFVKKWLADPTRKEFYKIDFLPKMKAPENTYNLFRGFDIPALKGDYSVFTELLWLVSGKNQAVADYIEKWVASVIQMPWKKTGICIVVKGKKGIGKDTYFDAIGRIIGNKHFLTTSKPEMEVFGKFNSQLSQLLLLKFEEANFETNRDNEDQLKKLITSEHESIERKGHDPIRTRSCVNMVMTTNKHIPIPMSDDERRFMLVEASEDRRGDTEYWRKVQSAVRDRATLAAYHEHLMSIDLTNFEPTNVIKTHYYHDVLQTFVPYHARYFQRMLEDAGEERTETYHWSARSLFLAMKAGNARQQDLTEQRFGRDMRAYDTIMTRTRKTYGSEYSCSPVALKAFLEEKQWWIDY